MKAIVTEIQPPVPPPPTWHLTVDLNENERRVLWRIMQLDTSIPKALKGFDEDPNNLAPEILRVLRTALSRS